MGGCSSQGQNCNLKQKSHFLYHRRRRSESRLVLYHLCSLLSTSLMLRAMVLRQGLARNAPRALRNPSSSVTPATRRGLAAPASGSYNYLSGEAAGVKFASRSLAGPTSTLALVAKAGTRYQPLPGLAEGLEKFAFKVRSRPDFRRYGNQVSLIMKHSRIRKVDRH